MIFYLFIYLYLFFMNSPTGQTRRRIFTLDGSNDADSRKDVPFWGFVDIALHFRGEIPQKPHQEIVVSGPNRRPTNPRWRTAAILKKPLNRYISATV